MKATKYTLCSDAFLPVNVYQNDCNYIVHYCGKQRYLRFSSFFFLCVCAFVVAGVSVGGINVVAYSVVVVVLFIVLMLHLSL